MADIIKTALVKIAHHDHVHVAQRYPYAAYGSNLLLDQVATRCNNASVLHKAALEGWRLDFSRVATITQDESSSVPIGVYRLSPEDVRKMDQFEGHARVYDRFLVTPTLADGRQLRCFTYIKRTAPLEPPVQFYFDKIAKGYREWDFDLRVLNAALERAKVAWEAGREEREKRREREARERSNMGYDNYEAWNDYGSFYGGKRARWNEQRRRDHRGRWTPTTPTVADYERTANLNGGSQIVLPLNVPRFMTARHHEVEWGQRSDELFFRLKGSRTWYKDVSGHDDIQAGMVRGEFEQSLPGAQAFTPVDGKKPKKGKKK
jgi:gamma-glutamylcyclotransferase (GGCT)/AIG2-like uncharacterized protein YtfP